MDKKLNSLSLAKNGCLYDLWTVYMVWTIMYWEQFCGEAEI